MNYTYIHTSYLKLMNYTYIHTSYLKLMNYTYIHTSYLRCKCLHNKTVRTLFKRLAENVQFNCYTISHSKVLCIIRTNLSWSSCEPIPSVVNYNTCKTPQGIRRSWARSSQFASRHINELVEKANRSNIKTESASKRYTLITSWNTFFFFLFFCRGGVQLFTLPSCQFKVL